MRNWATVEKILWLPGLPTTIHNRLSWNMSAGETDVHGTSFGLT